MTPQAVLAQNAYRQVQTDSASPEETVVLLFEGMVRFLYRAREAMEHSRYEEQSHFIGRAQRILGQLTVSLDESFDEALAVSLRCSYTAMYNRLMEANIADDLAALDEVIGLAGRFAQAWRLALHNVTVGAQTATVRPTPAATSAAAASC